MTQSLKKEIYILEQAEEEIDLLPNLVRKRYWELITEFEQKGYLEYPDSKKLEGYDLFEIRIIVDGIYRIIYCYYNNFVIILSAFRKKTQRTPLKEIQKALKRKNNIRL
ncbi:MAG: type II toxin-antitoxin system RelE/ParE family toxin [Candidatus Dojkabacteria bacterium]